MVTPHALNTFRMLPHGITRIYDYLSDTTMDTFSGQVEIYNNDGLVEKNVTQISKRLSDEHYLFVSRRHDGSYGTYQGWMMADYTPLAAIHVPAHIKMFKLLQGD